MTEQAEAFGPYLESALRRAGLSNRAAAKLAGVADVTIGTYINGKTRPTVPTLTALVRALGLNPEEAFQSAGLPVPADLVAIRAGAAELTNAELLSLLKDRLVGNGGTATRLPPAQFTDAQIRARGRLVVRLDVLADEAREHGDTTAVEALCDLVDAFKAQMTAAMEAEISEDQSQRPQSGK